MSSKHAQSSSGSGARSAPVKFLCSHGGIILPLPPNAHADAHLKYVGGETRVISVHRHITFPELIKKLTSMFNGEMVLKYQLIPEDFDVLVTVKSDDDLRHMIDECDRHEHEGAPRLRAFLFPNTRASVMANHHQSHEQRYINSINGTVIVNPNPSLITNPSSLSLARHHSSPSLCNLDNNSVTNHLSPITNMSPNLTQSHNHMHPKPPLDHHPHKSSGPTGVAEYYRQQSDQTTPSRKAGHTYHQRGSHYDDDDDYGKSRHDQTDSPPSPDGSSSSHSIRSRR